METPDFAFGWLFLKTILAMGVILILALVTIRYLLPRLKWGKPGTGTRIEIIERTGLEPRKALYLVRVGKKVVLLGTSDQRITNLMNLTLSEVEEK